MAAPLGNEYYKLRATDGAPRKYEDPEELWADCFAYFEQRGQIFWNEQPVPFTQGSLCIYLGITQSTWVEWRKSREDLSEVITRVDEIIRDQKLSGAVVGAYNANIVARDLGLADKQQHGADSGLAGLLGAISNQPRLSNDDS